MDRARLCPKVFGTGLLPVALLLVSSCTDEPVQPSVGDSPSVDAPVRSSMWVPAADGLQYWGSLKQGPEGWTREDLSPSEILAHQTKLEGALPRPMAGLEPSLAPSAGRGNGQLRATIPPNARKHKPVTGTLADGRKYRIESIGSFRKGQPPIASLVYIEDQLKVINHWRYERGANGSELRGVKSTVYDDDGKVILVHETEYDAQEIASASSSFTTELAALAGALKEKCGDVVGLLGPQALQAQFLECQDFELASQAAAAAAAAALVALAEVALPCVLGQVITCPGTIGAVAAVAVTGAAALTAWGLLQDCLNGEQSGGSEEGWGSGGMDGGCYIVELWISHDHGITWQYLDSYIMCDGGGF